MEDEDAHFFRREGFLDDLVVLVDRFPFPPPLFDGFLVGFVDRFAGALARPLAGGAGGDGIGVTGDTSSSVACEAGPSDSVPVEWARRNSSRLA